MPNELYAQNMEYRHQYDEIVKHFAEGRLKEAGAIQKDLQLHNVNIASYYTDKYALWLDFRTIDDNRLHGLGRRLENSSEGIRLQITKKAESAGKLSCYLYIFQDAQINISDSQFYNPKITKVEVTVEGVPNELYAQNMEYRYQYDEIVKHFAEGRLKEAGAIQKDLQLHNVNIASYYTDKYALWLDFRTIDDNRLHGLGRRLENSSEGIRLQITKKAESAGKLSCYLYIFQDAQINISDSQFLNVVY